MRSFLKIFLVTLPILCGTMSCSTSNSNRGQEDEKALATSAMPVKRYGSVIKVKPEKLDQYKQLHADPWPGILDQISKSNIRNYSIYLKDDYLFSYFEYTGNDFAADMAKMAADSLTQAWWKMTDPCQVPLETRAEGEWWASMEEVFHHD
ncbi:MAG: L-rhamnose mutarotase [Saprospiraceae bacterium]|nr:L-rhamnose mutarotase [Saprospiraceae bacterium]